MMENPTMEMESITENSATEFSEISFLSHGENDKKSRENDQNTDNGVSSETVLPQEVTAKYNALGVLILRPQEKKWKAWLIPTFVIINVITLFVSMGINNCPKNSSHCFLRFLGRFSFEPLKHNPMIGPSTQTLFKMGGQNWTMLVEHHQVWRLLTSMFLHAGIVHLVLNMLTLYPLGVFLEIEFGYYKIGLLYILSGIGCDILSGLFIQVGVAIGASGAIYGLIGAMLSEVLTNWTVYKNKVKATILLAIFSLLNLGLAVFPPHTDNYGHIGGFVSGFLLGFVLLVRPQFGWINKNNDTFLLSTKPKYKFYQNIYGIISLTLLVAGFGAGLMLLFRGVSLNDKCSWCRYFSCVPVGKFNCNSYKPYHCLISQNSGHRIMICQNVARSFTIPDSVNITKGSLIENCFFRCQY